MRLVQFDGDAQHLLPKRQQLSETATQEPGQGLVELQPQPGDLDLRSMRGGIQLGQARVGFVDRRNRIPRVLERVGDDPPRPCSAERVIRQLEHAAEADDTGQPLGELPLRVATPL